MANINTIRVVAFSAIVSLALISCPHFLHRNEGEFAFLSKTQNPNVTITITRSPVASGSTLRECFVFVPQDGHIVHISSTCCINLLYKNKKCMSRKNIIRANPFIIGGYNG